MPIKRKEKVQEETMFSQEDINKFRKAYSECKSEEEFFLKYKAIKIINGQWHVVSGDFAEFTKDPITGKHFDTPFPFSFYRRLQEQMEKQDDRRNYAQTKSIESVIGEKTLSESYLKTRNEIHKIFNPQKTDAVKSDKIKVRKSQGNDNATVPSKTVRNGKKGLVRKLPKGKRS